MGFYQPFSLHHAPTMRVKSNSLLTLLVRFLFINALLINVSVNAIPTSGPDVLRDIESLEEIAPQSPGWVSRAGSGVLEAVRWPWKKYLRLQEKIWLNEIQSLTYRIERDSAKVPKRPEPIWARAYFAPTSTLEEFLLPNSKDAIRYHAFFSRHLRKINEEPLAADAKVHRLEAAIRSAKTVLEEPLKLRAAVKEAVIYRDYYLKRPDVPPLMATMAVLEHLYRRFMLELADPLRPAASSGAPYPSPDRLLDAFGSWLQSPASKRFIWINDSSLVMEFAEFLYRTKTTHKSLTENELLTLFRVWLTHLPEETNFPFVALADEGETRELQHSITFKPFVSIFRYIDQGRFLPAQKEA